MSFYRAVCICLADARLHLVVFCMHIRLWHANRKGAHHKHTHTHTESMARIFRRSAQVHLTRARLPSPRSKHLARATPCTYTNTSKTTHISRVWVSESVWMYVCVCVSDSVPLLPVICVMSVEAKIWMKSQGATINARARARHTHSAAKLWLRVMLFTRDESHTRVIYELPSGHHVIALCACARRQFFFFWFFGTKCAFCINA